jgi:hypothetical protein
MIGSPIPDMLYSAPITQIAFIPASCSRLLDQSASKVQGNKDIESNPKGIRVLTRWKAR